MSETSNQMKLINSEFKSAAAETDQYGNRLDATGAKKKQLSGVIQQYQTRIKAITNEQKHWTSELEKGNITEEQHAQKQQELARRLNNTEAEMKRYEGQLKKLNAEGKATRKTYAEFDKQFRDVGRTMQQTGMKVGLVAGGMFASMVKPMKDAVNVTKEFDTEMSKVQALTGATADEFGQMKDMAKDLGATTSFTASQAASAISFLGMAGFETNEILDATPGLLNLAASAQMDLGRAADIASNIISGFNMEANQAGKVSDVLARASSNANTNVEQMGDAMATVAPIASTLGMSLEDMASGTMIMSDAGMQGQKAGRMLRQGLLRLAKPTGAAEKLIKKLGVNVFDADGNMKSLDKVVGELEGGLKGMSSKAQTAALATLFGSESTAGWSALLAAGSDTLKDYTADLENSEGAAETMAKTMRDNLQGSITQLQSGIEGLQIKLGEKLMPTVRGAADYLTDLVGKFNEMDDATVETIAQTALMVTAVLGVTTVVAGLATGIGALMMFAGPLGLALVGTTALLGALGIGLYASKKHTENLAKEQRRAKQDALNYGENLSEGTKQGVKGYTDLYENAKIKMVQLRTMSGDEATKTVKEIQEAFSQMADVVIAELEVQRDELTRVINEIYGTVGDAGKATAEVVTDQVLELFDKDIAEYKNARDTVNSIIEEYGSNWNDYPPKIKRAYDEAYGIMDQGAKVFAGTQKEMAAIQQRIVDQGGAIQNEQASKFAQQIKVTYEESLNAMTEFFADRVEILDKGLAQDKISHEEHDRLMQGLQSQTTSMYEDANKQRDEALKSLIGHVDKRGELLDLETGKVLEREKIYEKVDSAYGYRQESRLETDEEYFERWQKLQDDNLKSSSDLTKKTSQVYKKQQEEFLQSIGYTVEESVILSKQLRDGMAEELEKGNEQAQQAGQNKGNYHMQGLDGTTEGNTKTAEEMIDRVTEELSKGDDESYDHGYDKGQHHIRGLDHTVEGNKKAARTFSNATDEGLGEGKDKAEKHGKDKGDAHRKGLESTKKENENTGHELRHAVTDSLSRTTDGGGGNKAGGLFNTGLGSWKERVKNSGTAVANSGKAGLASVGTSSVGADFVSGFSNSIKSRTGVGSTIWGVAGALGRSALSGLKSAIKSASPSKLTGEEGINFTDGFTLAIDKGKKDSVRAASLVGKESLAALNDEVTGFKQAFGAIALAVEGNKQTLKVEHSLGSKFEEFASMFMANKNDEDNYNKELLDATLQQNQLLMQLLQKDNRPIIDQRSLARGLEPEISKLQGGRIADSEVYV